MEFTHSFIISIHWPMVPRPGSPCPVAVSNTLLISHIICCCKQTTTWRTVPQCRWTRRVVSVRLTGTGLVQRPVNRGALAYHHHLGQIEYCVRVTEDDDDIHGPKCATMNHFVIHQRHPCIHPSAAEPLIPLDRARQDLEASGGWTQ